MKLRFIFNPTSGRARRNAGMPSILKAFIAERSLDADVVCTEGPGHATELAREGLLSGCERMVAVGGDGTMNEVAQALLNSPAALALVPCGSGNGLALHLGLPTDPAQALDLAADSGACVAEIDTGEANGRPFFNAMGFGLDAEVSRRFNQLKRRGLVAYTRIAATAFLRHKPETCVVTSSGGREVIHALLIAVANSDQYGNKAMIAPGARINDGQLDLIAVRPVGAFSALPMAIRLFTGTFDRSPHVRRLKGDRFIIEREGPGILHADGETSSCTARVEVVVRPRSLKIVAPASSPALFHASSVPAGFALKLP